MEAPSSSYPSLRPPGSTTASSSSRVPKQDRDGEEAPFQQVKPRRSRRRIPTAPSSSSLVSDSNGSLISSSKSSKGFVYRTKNEAAKNTYENAEQRSSANSERRLFDRAMENINLFSDFLGSAVELEYGGQDLADAARVHPFARSLLETLSSIWSTSTSGELRMEDDTARTPSSRQRSNLSSNGKIGKLVGRQLPSRILCLGLGSPTTSRSAQIQLALLVVMRRFIEHVSCISNPSKDEEDNTNVSSRERMDYAEYRELNKNELPQDGINSSTTTRSQPLSQKKHSYVECIAYDPIFSQEDAELLAKLGVQVASPSSAPSLSSSAARDASDEAHIKPAIETYYTNISTPTLLYMPHCDRSLYESILSLNTATPSSSSSDEDTIASAIENLRLDSPASFPRTHIPNLTLLANTLNNYLISTSSARLSEESPIVSSLLPHLQVVDLPNWNPKKTERFTGVAEKWDVNALNELSFQWVPSHLTS